MTKNYGIFFLYIQIMNEYNCLYYLKSIVNYIMAIYKIH